MKPWKGAVSNSRILVVILATFVSLACDEPPAPPEPTEPWRAGEKTRPKIVDSRALVFDVDSQTRLHFRLPAKEATLLGSVGGLGGAFTVQLTELARTRGTVLFDLESLVMQADGVGDDAERTTEALNWLGLGLGVAADERRKLRYGRFEVDALHELSAARLDAKRADSPTEGQGRVVRIQAVAAGRLIVRNLSVARRVPIELDFGFSGAPGETTSPTALTVRLRAAEGVPLAEHGIAPRDAAGKDQPTGHSLLGRVVGKSALVTGEIALRPRVL